MLNDCVIHHPGYHDFSTVLQAWVKGSTWIPIFDVDASLELRTLSLKATNFLMGK